MKKNASRIVALVLSVILLLGVVGSGIMAILPHPGDDGYIAVNASHLESAGMPEDQALGLAKALHEQGVLAELTGIDTDDTGEFYLLNLLFADVDVVWHAYVDYQGNLLQVGVGEVQPEDLVQDEGQA